MGVFHKFHDNSPDIDNPDIVRPSDWNADHFSPAHLAINWFEGTSSYDTWLNQPAAVTALFGDNRTHTYHDMRFFTQARIVAEIIQVGASGSEIMAQYFDAGAWHDFGDVGPKLSLSALGLIASPWATYEIDDPHPIRIENALIRLAGRNGNGVADPRLRSAILQIR